MTLTQKIESALDKLAATGKLRDAASLADISWEDDYYVAKIGKPHDYSILDYAREVVREGLNGAHGDDYSTELLQLLSESPAVMDDDLSLIAQQFDGIEDDKLTEREQSIVKILSRCGRLDNQNGVLLLK